MKVFDIVEELEKERKKNKELEELCDKYEEEHKTTFEIWQKDIKANKKAIEYILNNTTYKSSTKEYGLKGNNKSQLLKISELLNILQGDNK